MDAARVLQLFNATNQIVDGRSCDELMQYMNYLELVKIEDQKTELFAKRLDFICASNVFQEAMYRDYGRKQVKRFLMKVWNWDEPRAMETANSLNEARRVYQHFGKIVKNCFECTHVDIRSFNIHELYLAKNLSWVIGRSVDIKPVVKKPAGVPMQLDPRSIEDTIQNIFNSDWYKEANENPFLVANVLKTITSRVLNDSVYRSGR